ncbi:MAG: DUF2065 family protein [Pseudomonadota bacterium]
MDLLASLALVLVIEGLALAVFASSLPELLAAVEGIEPGQMRILGFVFLAAGTVGYIAVRGW